MTAEELIEKLKSFPPKTIVAIDDWQEGWQPPSAAMTENIRLLDTKYLGLDGEQLLEGEVLVLGYNGD